MTPWDAVEAAVRAALGNAFAIHRYTPIAAAGQRAAYRVASADTSLFVKIERGAEPAHFAADVAALRELGRAAALRAPEPVCHGHGPGCAFLVTEFIELRPLNEAAMARLGEGLAELHGIVADRFGWSHDNHLGATVQRNARHGDWTEFYRENRLARQLELAAGDGAHALARAGDRLLARLGSLLAGHRPEASLVHGDFWAGNAAMDDAGRPVIFDPALHYADRETDLAMAELFGGFSPLFFEAYQGAWPLSPGYRAVRRDLYQLYHLLNHHHLFGGHYAGDAQRAIERLLAGG